MNITTDEIAIDLPDISSDLSLLERVNPVFNTGKMTLFQLASIGDQNAAALANMLGLNAQEAEGDIEQDTRTVGNIVLETRYRTMAALAQQSGCATEVDLPCGYTPRALDFAAQGLPYVGLDLPAAIHEAEPAITSLLDKDKRDLVRFFGVDATNYASLKQAFDQVEGDVCITTEGLLMYFTDSEAGQLCDSIRRILLEHGGCWLLADVEVPLQYILTTKAFYGDRFMEVMQKRQNYTAKKSDFDVKARTLVADPRGDVAAAIREAMVFLGKHGLRAERLVVADHVPELATLATLPEAQAAQIKESMKSYAFWKVTPIREMPLDTSQAQADHFELAASLDEDTLTLRVAGRVDTLTAPNLLDFYEKVSGEHDVDEVVLDCSQLSYISSAGLRVITMMCKACSRGVTMRAANDSVREVLEQTGLDDIVRMTE